MPYKVLRYIPLGLKLKFLFGMMKSTKLIRWHHTRKSTDDDVIQHLVNSKAWKDFDKNNPQFAKEVRNVRLGSATDGFNLFDNMSLSHNMWPVVLTTYNLPLWLCMKPKNLMLTLLIPGP